MSVGFIAYAVRVPVTLISIIPEVSVVHHMLLVPTALLAHAAPIVVTSFPTFPDALEPPSLSAAHCMLLLISHLSAGIR